MTDGRSEAPSAPPSPPPEVIRAAPVPRTERIVSLDVLRGLAVLGILIINIEVFSMIGSALMNPTAYGDLAGANLVVWVLGYTLANQKFMTIFSMLFGAGIALMASRAESRGVRPAGSHYLRMMWLTLFGLLHAHLLWYGDILFSYAICGMIAYPLRRLSPRWLIVLGVLLIAVASVLWLFFGWSMQFWPAEVMEDFEREWQPSMEVAESELAVYRGGWLEQMTLRVPSALELETIVLLFWVLWRAGGLMLVGMALHKLDVFSARRSRGLYLGMVAVGLVVGIPVVLYGIYRNFASGWDLAYCIFLGSQFNYWGSLLVSVGWIGGVMLACRAPWLGGLTRPLASVGQMALTNYLLQTIICTTIFYGHGLGLFGRVERVGQIGIVAAIWAFQLVVSPFWLRHFRFGPFEWLWRTLTYRRLQPMRRTAA